MSDQTLAALRRRQASITEVADGCQVEALKAETTLNELEDRELRRVARDQRAQQRLAQKTGGR